MKLILNILIVVFTISFISCEKVSPNAVELSVDYTWEGMKPCGWGNPEIRFSGVPEETKYIKIHMFDHVYNHDHGEVTVPFTGSRMFKKDSLQEIQGPCPPGPPGRYEITIKAIDEGEVVIGIGSKERHFPEK